MNTPVMVEDSDSNISATQYERHDVYDDVNNATSVVAADTTINDALVQLVHEPENKPNEATETKETEKQLIAENANAMQEHAPNNAQEAHASISNAKAAVTTAKKRKSETEMSSLPMAARSSTPIISREFLALQRSLNESQVLTNMVSDTSQSNIRKSRKSFINDAVKNGSTSSKRHRRQSPAADSNSSSAYRKRMRSKSCHSPTTFDGDVLNDVSQDSFASKRSNMRSQNAEFKQKYKDFLQRVNSDMDGVEYNNSVAGTLLNSADDVESLHDYASNDRSSQPTDSKVRSSADSSNNVESSDSRMAFLLYATQQCDKPGSDAFCFKCHLNLGAQLHCSKCVRSYHQKCIKTMPKSTDAWICPECVLIENAQNEKRNRRSGISVEFLNELLNIALTKMRQEHATWRNKRSERSIFELSIEELPGFYQQLVHTPTFVTLQEKINKKSFRCTEEFISETKWIAHNAEIINNSVASRSHLLDAQYVLKMCRQECNEIDLCPDCYQKAQTNTDWFVDVCSQPHILLWAKLKGFPYWPAKAMDSGQANVVNVRFFGDHDRSAVQVKDCYLYSERDPNLQTSKKNASNLKNCMSEVNVHIENIKKKIGKFVYAEFKTPYDPTVEKHQLEEMMPGVAEFMRKQQMAVKEPLQFKIVKTDGTIAMVKSSDTAESGTESDQAVNKSNDKNATAAEQQADKESAVGKTKTALQSNYEVVPSVSADTNNATKVIIKRKSIAHEHNISPSKTAKFIKPAEDAKKHKHSNEPTNVQADKQQRLPKVTIKAAAHKSCTATGTATIVSSSQGQEHMTKTLKIKRKVAMQRKRYDQLLKHGEVEQQQKELATEQQSKDPLAVDPLALPLAKQASKKVKKSTPRAVELASPQNLLMTEMTAAITNSTTNEHVVGVRALHPFKLEPECENIALQETLTEQRNDNEDNSPTQKIVLKEEPLSDDDVTELDPLPMNVANITSTNMTKNDKQTEVMRIVNDSISSQNKNASPPQTTAALSPINNAKQSNNNRSSSSVPFGPLPAGASNSAWLGKAPNAVVGIVQSTTASATKTQKVKPTQATVMQPTVAIQRARKTFPNRTVNNKSEATANQSSGLRKMAPASTSNLILQNNMVSIPVDANNCSNYLMSPVLVPPLTAVSKTLLQVNSSSCNSGNVVAAKSTTTTATANTDNVGVNFNTNTGPPPLAGLTITPPNSAIVYNDNTAIVDASTAAATNTKSSNGIITESSTDALVLPFLSTGAFDATFRDLPRMIPCPNVATNSDHCLMSNAGPITQKLIDNAHKLTDFFINAMTETIGSLAEAEETDYAPAKVAWLKLEMETMKIKHEQELAELKRSHDLKLTELRKSMENERMRNINEVRKQCEFERKRAVDDAKREQWCSRCLKQAKFYCCWNTTYCTLDCQRMHWPIHQSSCQVYRSQNHVTQATTNVTTDELSPQLINSNSNSNTSHNNNTSGSNIVIASNSTSISTADVRALTKTLPNIPTKITIRKTPMVSTNVTKKDKIRDVVTPADLLKLPATTLVRPVIVTTTNTTINNNNNNINSNSSSTSNRIVVTSHNNASNINARLLPTLPANSQRFNLPISNNVPYTLVQSNNVWEIRSPATITPMSSQTVNQFSTINNNNNNMQRISNQHQRNQNQRGMTSIQLKTIPNPAVVYKQNNT